MSGAAKILGRVAIFQDLSAEQIGSLAALTTDRRFGKGEVIVDEGAEGDDMFVLAEGQVSVSKRLVLRSDGGEYQDKDKTFTVLDAEQAPFFGEMALLEHNVRTARIAGMTEGRLLVIDREAFEGFCREDPVAGLAVLRRLAVVVSQRLRATNQDVLKLTTALSVALSR